MRISFGVSGPNLSTGHGITLDIQTEDVTAGIQIDLVVLLSDEEASRV